MALVKLVATAPILSATIHSETIYMKIIDNLSVGVKIGTESFSVDCKLPIPETVEDCVRLSKGSASFHAQMFERGWRIWNQEQTGARDVVRDATVAERKDVPKLAAKVQAVIDAADPLTPPKRTGRPATPKEAKMTPAIVEAMKSGDASKLAAELAAQGIRLNFVK
jgi:hypothetical protein